MTAIADTDLEQQVRFLMEADKLKGVDRRTKLVDKSRFENSAEHSWHVALCAMVFSSYAADEVDLSRVIRMLLIHDIVEIDAGDTFAYDSVGYEDKLERETEASNRLFGVLPASQGTDLSSLWAEFEENQSPEARYANAIDRVMPVLHNYYAEGASWQKHDITRDQVLKRISVIVDGAPALWPFMTDLLDDAVKKGYLLP